MDADTDLVYFGPPVGIVCNRIDETSFIASLKFYPRLNLWPPELAHRLLIKPAAGLRPVEQ